ncbi:hypothetical protein LSH36_979g01002 [Paralvinella palmiformis]|uniref:Uncharacterized protein n=1 Tax=Paralvinella palmiformis TaxID=53620 RepID=A0AAD9IWQ1_9ANNE|nr:hypothetical protein LSH36_979g01002 [Paralvinella palmiformis]
MGVILLSLKLALFYSVATVISFPQDANAWELYTEKENYNFMIGGDGTVFEGRGWDKFSNHYFSNDHVEYAVAYIGESITEKMRESFLYWRACGTSKGMLQIDITSENHFSRH